MLIREYLALLASLAKQLTAPNEKGLQANHL
jgi:hypothetical protein